ncbi:MAG: tRNA pseudouridine(55) synthase TruB [Alphaproteobacteria bacterium]|nr:tRNA pseudouridine(55) synthase TruB [Alphaproteobacteria bacterium]MBV9062354.1 tRNA pseudouridine(55) synthase TruB [Alphaproteobacteria bacterium]
MGRRRKGAAVHGWVVVDKPEGITSTQVVAIVRRVFDAQKAGHAGTLDPMATGVLAVALGEATKTVPYAMESEKAYRFTACWGEARDSDDAEGRVTATCEVRPGKAQIEAMLPRFLGKVTQVPPAYSAIKVQGERAYDLARGGETVCLEPRTVTIHEARVAGSPDPEHTEFEMRCGKGAYVRAWVRDLALALGTVGHVSQLRRTAVGGFSEKDAVALETLQGSMHSPAAFEHLRPISTALDGIPALAVTGPDAVRLRSGNPILMRANLFARLTEEADNDDLQGLTVYLSTGDGEPVALAALQAGELRPFRVFNFGTG